MLGRAVRQLGDPARGPGFVREGLAGHMAIGDRAFMVFGLEDMAAVLASQAQPVRAAQVFGAMAALRDVLAATPSPFSQRSHAQIEAAVRSQLPAADYLAAWNEGRVLPLHEVVTRALEERPRAVAAATLAPMDCAHDEQATAPKSLTPREHEVARLLAQGYTDRQIAAALTIAVSTAGVHVHHVLAKLGLRSRWQVTDRVVGQDPLTPLPG